MSLIHVPTLRGESPFDCNTHRVGTSRMDQTAWNPANWMPWNYRQTLANALMTPTAS